MQVNKRTAAGRNGVAAGSVWESRMKIDQGKGGIKVFNGRENPQQEVEEEEDDDKGTGLKSIRTVGRNRRTWKSGIEGDPVQLKKSRSELLKKLAVDFNKDKIFKGRFRKTALSNGNYEDEDEENVEDEEKEMEKEIEKIDIKEMNSAEEKQRTIEEKDKIHQIHEIPISVSSPWAEEKIHEQPISAFKQMSVTNKEKLQKIQAKLRKIHESPTSPFKQWNDAEREKANQIHEIPPSPFRHRSDEEKEKLHQIHEIPISPIKKRCVGEKDKIQQIHEIPEYFEKQRSLAEKQKLYQFHEIPTSPDEEKKPPLSTDHPSVDPDLRKPPPIAVAVAVEETFENKHETHNRLQSIVGLVMWRDLPKSAFVFGLGAFILLSSSLTKDLNFSLVSSISYLGLFYLAAIFLYKSIICRGAVDFEEGSQNYIVGEEEAIWVLKLILPYFNELLINMRGLFSGDPATTMKLATLLFVLARCGNSITIWTMTRLAFFGVFTLPKFFSAYSTQITGYGKFWVRRFRDAWDSCTHKKVVAATMFTFIWNSSSITARIWAVFMLIVAVRFYQQSSLSPSTINEEWCEEEAQQDSKGGQCMEQKVGGSTQANVEKEKEKKRS
ncbi:hypothetical protein AAC387_Pa03g0336 [Persea americana]